MQLRTKCILIEKLLFPIVIVCIAAIAGSIVGDKIQTRQFRETTLFKARFDLLFKRREDAVSMMVEFNKISSQIQANEQNAKSAIDRAKGTTDYYEIKRWYCKEENFKDQISELQNIYHKMIFLKSYSNDSTVERGISANIDSFTMELGNYIVCLKNKNRNCDVICSSTYATTLQKLQVIVDSYTKELNLIVTTNKQE